MNLYVTTNSSAYQAHAPVTPQIVTQGIPFPGKSLGSQGSSYACQNCLHIHLLYMYITYLQGGGFDKNVNKK